MTPEASTLAAGGPVAAVSFAGVVCGAEPEPPCCWPFAETLRQPQSRRGQPSRRTSSLLRSRLPGNRSRSAVFSSTTRWMCSP